MKKQIVTLIHKACVPVSYASLEHVFGKEVEVVLPLLLEEGALETDACEDQMFSLGPNWHEYYSRDFLTGGFSTGRFHRGAIVYYVFKEPHAVSVENYLHAMDRPNDDYNYHTVRGIFDDLVREGIFKRWEKDSSAVYYTEPTARPWLTTIFGYSHLEGSRIVRMF